MQLIFIFLMLNSIASYAQITISSNQVEDIYTQAVDARFTGDLAKSRNLLENLKENNFTNEYILSLLTEVYLEYLTSLIKNKDYQVLKVAYPGIRKNIADIWDLYPNIPLIQENSLKITMITGDQQFGLLISEMILQKNPSDFFANYFMGMMYFTPKDYIYSIPYFKRVACTPIELGKEQYIFYSQMNLGDIYLETLVNLDALKYYYKALELSSTPELIAKLAVLETYRGNFKIGLELFTHIPVSMMTRELFDSYIGNLWSEGSQQSKFTMNFLLSQTHINTLFIQAMIQSQLGRTQKALALLKQEEFMKNNLPDIYYRFMLDLNKRLGKTDELFDIQLELGKFAYKLNDIDLAYDYIHNLSLKNDTNGELAYLLANIKRKKFLFKDAKNLYYDTLTKQTNITLYTDLIELEINCNNTDKAKQLIQDVQKLKLADDFWVQFMNIYVSFRDDNLEKIEANLLQLIKKYSNNQLLNNFLVLAYFKQEKFDELEILLNQQYQFDPSNNLTKNHIAYYYAITKQNLNQALELSLETLKDDPKEITYLDTLAWIYTIQQDYDQAQKVFDQIEEQVSHFPFLLGFEELYAHLGYFYKKIGNNKKSKLYFDQAFKINSNSKYVNKLYTKQ